MANPVALDREKLSAKQKLLSDTAGAIQVGQLIELGRVLGLYPALRDAGAVTSEALAERTGLNERWLREWLRAQAAAGVIDYLGDDRFALSPEVAKLLTDPNDLQHLGGAFENALASVATLPRVAKSFRTGLGVSFDERGAEVTARVERAFGNWYRQILVPVALPKLDGVVARLAAGAQVADVGCGAGVALIEMAKVYPRSRFAGYETSRFALERGAQNARDAGVANVSFHDATTDPLPPDARFDLITTFDCLHDMTRPHLAAAAIRTAVRPDGCWFIADIDSQPTFEENLARHPFAARLYSTSVLGCLGTGTAEPGGAGLGTVGLPEPRMRELVQNAGFSRFDRVDLPSPVNAYYLARP